MLLLPIWLWSSMETSFMQFTTKWNIPGIKCCTVKFYYIFQAYFFFFFFTDLRQNLIQDWPLFKLYKPFSPTCSDFLPSSHPFLRNFCCWFPTAFPFRFPYPRCSTQAMCEFYGSYVQCLPGNCQGPNWTLKPRAERVTIQAKKKSTNFYSCCCNHLPLVTPNRLGTVSSLVSYIECMFWAKMGKFGANTVAFSGIEARKFHSYHVSVMF